MKTPPSGLHIPKSLNNFGLKNAITWSWLAMKILVTGAAGMVGSHLADALLEKGHYVIGLDNFWRGVPENLTEAKKQENFHFIKGDICDTKVFTQIPSVDCIFHLAAIVPSRCFYEMPIENFEVNTIGTKNVLDFAKKIEVDKFIFASSSEIYGHSVRIPTKEDSGSFLDSPDVTTRWSYAVSKLAGEYLSLAYGKKWFNVVILRYANVYGPRDVGTEHIIPYAISSTLRNQPITLHVGAEKRKRSFMYISDCVDATILAMLKGNSGSILNIGSTKEITILKLVKKIFSLCGNSIKITYDSLPPGDPKRRLLDISRAEKTLGFKPKVSLDEGLMKTIEWIKPRLSEIK
jgi:nucleoside-diphosphate-sugar epimerase